nr:ATP-dependent helicase HrpB [uncultured Prevotella sp.]
MTDFTSINSQASTLPALSIADSINQTLKESANLVVTAPPGAGKSTLLPLTILEGMNSKGKILMLEPRRLAARQIAERMANLIGEPTGKTVGYRVRFENKVSAETRIEVLTEGILTRMLVNDATLEGIDAIIFDEFHERSIHSDLALALTLQAQHIIRPDLKIIIMSATIDTSFICQKLQAPLIECAGRMFPVQTVYAEADVDKYNIYKEVAAMVMRAHRDQEGDNLAFLPGQADILRCEELLANSLAGTSTQIYPLYGNFPPEKQRQAIAPSRHGERKIVLATPIAETSLTIEGVRIVVDSGLCRQLVFDAHTGLSHLTTVRISKDMAIQRRGRAGRVAEGICYRLWTQTSEHLMQEQRKPEIEEADLTSMVLDIAAYGEKDPMSLPWLTPPSHSNIYNAKHLLLSLQAISEDGSATLLGKEMAALPCHPRIAKMILCSDTDAQKALACDMAALLEEKDPMSENADSDMTLRITMLRSQREKKNLGRWARIAQIAQEYRKLLQVKEDNHPVAPEAVGSLIASAYPERIAMALDNIGNFRLSGGQSLFIDKEDPMSTHSWLAIASLNAVGKKGKVFLSAPVNINDLPTSTYTNISWDSKAGMVRMQRESRIGMLVIESKPIHDADKEEVIDIICSAVKKDGLSMFDWNEQVKRLQQRVAKIKQWHPEKDVPDLSTEHLMKTATEWLPFYLEQEGKLKTTIAELKKLDLAEILWAQIPYELQEEIDRLAPTHIEVPSGSRIRIDYRPGAEAPVLSVRLQECFGMNQTPKIDNGRQPLLMELLSPGFKPVQLTQDLASFWQGTYFEVRKELKRRYPKHFWPENPLESEAVRGVKRSCP